MMGEATYNHVFADADATNLTQRLALAGSVVATPTGGGVSGGASPARSAAPALDTDDDEPGNVRLLPGTCQGFH